MDQLKEALRQAVKYRFWIAVGVSALLFLLAYFTGTGSLAKEEKEGSDQAKAADEGAKKYISGVVKNAPWTQAVTEKTAVLNEDVNAAWRRLYERQAPLLDWPQPVADAFAEWGEAYPKIDPSAVTAVILRYTQAYPDYVETVYQSFKPFNFEDGMGIVAAPSKGALLRPQVFSEDSLPTLNEVWSAQRKLWIERTMLELVAAVNERAKAKDWDGATIKQIVMLEVANALAIDQKTVAKGEDTLEDATPIEREGAPVPAKTEAAPAVGVGGRPAAGGYAARMGALGGEDSSSSSEPIGFVKSNSSQFYIVPVALTVYIEQDRVADLLAACKNSPMPINVKDFQMMRPRFPVRKPRKGQGSGNFAGLMGAGRGMGLGRGTDEILGGDMFASGGGGGGGMDADSYAGGGQSAYTKGRGSTSALGGRAPTGNKKSGGAKSSGTGKNVAAESLANINKQLKEKAKKDEPKPKDEEEDDSPESSASNPYFNVVEVTIRGQARFYRMPPKAATPDPNSPGATSPEPAKAATPDPAKDAAPDSSKDGAAKADTAAKDAPKPDAATKDAPKADANPPQEADPKADAPKPDTPKPDAPADAPAGPDTPKADTPKPDAPKPDAGAPKDAPPAPKR